MRKSHQHALFALDKNRLLLVLFFDAGGAFRPDFRQRRRLLSGRPLELFIQAHHDLHCRQPAKADGSIDVVRRFEALFALQFFEIFGFEQLCGIEILAARFLFDHVAAHQYVLIAQGSLEVRADLALGLRGLDDLEPVH